MDKHEKEEQLAKKALERRQKRIKLPWRKMTSKDIKDLREAIKTMKLRA